MRRAFRIKVDRPNWDEDIAPQMFTLELKLKESQKAKGDIFLSDSSPLYQALERLEDLLRRWPHAANLVGKHAADLRSIRCRAAQQAVRELVSAIKNFDPASVPHGTDGYVRAARHLASLITNPVFELDTVRVRLGYTAQFEAEVSRRVGFYYESTWLAYLRDNQDATPLTPESIERYAAMLTKLTGALTDKAAGPEAIETTSEELDGFRVTIHRQWIRYTLPLIRRVLPDLIPLCQQFVTAYGASGYTPAELHTSESELDFIVAVSELMLLRDNP